jgi:predicted dehydrogenase
VNLRFAAIDIDHRHIFDHIAGLIAAGGTFVGYTSPSTAPDVVEEVRRRWPAAKTLAREEILGDRSIELVCTSAVPRERAGVAIAAMRAGKDVMVDKPGVTTAAQLDEVEAAVRETGRLYSICFTERLCVRAAERAGELVAAGAIGKVVQTMGVGPHRLNRAIRPDWFFEPEAAGGILTDIASHQIDQFLFYTGSKTAEVVASTIGNYGAPQNPRFQDFGQVLLQSVTATGYIRVDWFTPDGLPTWGDGRLTILGTEGTIELRKYVDIAGRPGGDHLFLVDRDGVRHIDCSAVKLTYFDRFAADVRERTETAMPQRHVFETMRLALEAQARANRAHMSASSAGGAGR